MIYNIDNNQYEVTNMNGISIENICKALGDANRLKIFKLLSKGEMCGCKLLEEFNISQPTLSHHMKILCDCSLVKIRKDGKWSHYSINCDTLKYFKNFISDLDCVVKEEMECK